MSRSFAWIFSLIIAFIAGYYVHRPAHDDSPVASSNELREGGYTLINPLLECQEISNQGNTKLSEIEEKVKRIIVSKNHQEVSVYYRDLLNGPWYGYHEDAAFAPQSLLKLPIIIAYLKIADENPDILSNEIDYFEEMETNLRDDEALEPGKKYTVDQLIQRTARLSDNVAFNLLIDNIPSKYVKKVHEDLNIPYPSDTTPVDFISVKSYSSIFRVLYNSSYLSRKHSEYLLALLNKSDFSDGLVQGVPENIAVSHKFGIRNASNANEVSQLHDCGIVYQPDRPYLLCIMTKGHDQQEQTNTIAQISSAIFAVISQE